MLTCLTQQRESATVMQTQAVAVLTTGGTIDKVYFDAKSEFAVGDSMVEELLKQAHVNAPYRVEEIMRKDSLELDDADRDAICAAVEGCPEQCVVITHGTDTMADSASALLLHNALVSAEGVESATQLEKTVVFTGALSPARFATSDATFNVGMAFAAVQTLAAGVYIVMNGQVFAAGSVRKDVANNVFVRLLD